MATLEQRKNATGGKKAAAPAVASSPSRRAASQPSRSFSSKKRSSDDEEEDDSADQDDQPEERAAEEEDDAVGRSASHRRPSASKPSLRASINFTQLLVFGCLMLQGLTLFITYHNMLITQPILFKLETQVAAIEKEAIKFQARTNQLVTTQLEVTQQLVEQLREDAMQTVAMASTIQTGDDDRHEAEEIEAEIQKIEGDEEEEVAAEEATEDAHQDVLSAAAALYTRDDGSVDFEALDKVVLQQMGREGEETPYYGGNNMMLMSAAEFASLHEYRNWTDEVSPDGDVVTRDAGPEHNQTTTMMRAINQYDENGLIRDILVKESVRDDRTTLAARDMKKGEYFWKIDQKHILTYTVVAQTEVGKALASNPLFVDDMVVLSVFILYEKMNPQSPWKYWLNMLPTSYAFMPTMYSPADLQLIKNTQVLTSVEEYQLQYREEYIALSSHLENFSHQFTFSQYCWARYAIGTRAFDMDMAKETIDPVTGVSKREKVVVTAMCPADLINHEGEDHKVDSVWGWNEPTKQFAFRTLRDIKKGQEITTTYGNRGNTALLVHYGFTLKYNPFDYAVLCMSTHVGPAPEEQEEEEESTDDEAKLSLLADLYNGGEAFDDTCSSKLPANSPAGHGCRLQRDLLSSHSHECYQWARIAVASPSELVTLTTAHHADLAKREKAEQLGQTIDADWAVLDMEPWDLANEIKAVALVAEFANHQQALIPGGSAADDHAILDAHDAAVAAHQCIGDAASHPRVWFPRGACLTYAQVNLLRVRSGEKVVLEKAARLARLVSEFVALQPADIEAAYAFITAKVAYTPAELAHYQAQSVTPDFSLVRYMNEIFLPLYFRSKAWGVEATVRGVKTLLAKRNQELFNAVHKSCETPKSDPSMTEPFNFTDPEGFTHATPK